MEQIIGTISQILSKPMLRMSNAHHRLKIKNKEGEEFTVVFYSKMDESMLAEMKLEKTIITIDKCTASKRDKKLLLFFTSRSTLNKGILPNDAKEKSVSLLDEANLCYITEVEGEIC